MPTRDETEKLVEETRKRRKKVAQKGAAQRPSTSGEKSSDKDDTSKSEG